MLTQVTVIVPEPLQVLGRWHFSVGELRAACGDQLHLNPGPATITITVHHHQDQHISFAYTAIARLEITVPMQGGLTVIFPTVRASKALTCVADLLVNIMTQL